MFTTLLVSYPFPYIIIQFIRRREVELRSDPKLLNSFKKNVTALREIDGLINWVSFKDVYISVISHLFFYFYINICHFLWDINFIPNKETDDHFLLIISLLCKIKIKYNLKIKSFFLSYLFTYRYISMKLVWLMLQFDKRQKVTLFL